MKWWFCLARHIEQLHSTTRDRVFREFQYHVNQCILSCSHLQDGGEPTPSTSPPHSGTRPRAPPHPPGHHLPHSFPSPQPWWIHFLVPFLCSQPFHQECLAWWCPWCSDPSGGESHQPRLLPRYIQNRLQIYPR